MKICVYGAASGEIDQSYVDQGIELGHQIVDRGHSLIFGGGIHGMMGAVAQGVHERGGDILGIAPQFFKEVKAEITFPYCTNFIRTDSVRERKDLLDEKSDAFIITPGGIGTFDEFFEILTLKQLGRHNKAIVLYNINNYFDPLIQMMQLSIDENFITTSCVDLFKVMYNSDAILDYIEHYDPEDIDLSKVKIR